MNPQDLSESHHRKAQRQAPEQKAQECDANSKLQGRLQHEQIRMGVEGGYKYFNLFKDTLIGLGTLDQPLIHQRFDEDIQTTEDCLRNAKKACMQDLFNAIENNNSMAVELASKAKSSIN